MKKQKTKSKPSQFFVKIERSEYKHITRHAKAGEQWDGDDTHSDHEIHGFRVVSEGEEWDFVLPYDPTGKTMYLVCAFYDTGDSFHREENRLCLVSLQEHVQDAQAILKACEADYKAYEENDDGRNPLPVKLPIADKTEEVYTGDWKGYFERLRELRIEILGTTGMSVKFY